MRAVWYMRKRRGDRKEYENSSVYSAGCWGDNQTRRERSSRIRVGETCKNTTNTCPTDKSIASLPKTIDNSTFWYYVSHARTLLHTRPYRSALQVTRIAIAVLFICHRNTANSLGFSSSSGAQTSDTDFSGHLMKEKAECVEQ